jgi:hypothetical protein
MGLRETFRNFVRNNIASDTPTHLDDEANYVPLIADAAALLETHPAWVQRAVDDLAKFNITTSHMDKWQLADRLRQYSNTLPSRPSEEKKRFVETLKTGFKGALEAIKISLIQPMPPAMQDADEGLKGHITHKILDQEQQPS